MSWTLIEHISLSSSAASVTLGNGGTLPQTYKTLKLVVSARLDTGNAAVRFKPNGLTTNLTARYIFGNGSTASSGTYTSPGIYAVPNTATANTFGNAAVEIPNYSGSTNKPMSVDTVNEDNATGTSMALDAWLWSSSAALTSIVLAPDSGNMVSGSTFTLYGLK